ncbi:putative nucleotidyltransferase with HDIG domain [Desulfobotulus alkaliphilus]|uniref:Putative nucleotidyltransferase with HDIG domain n=1 Tax=Desulfobotulus alkaliphilus TaxID=622671 RepID=A0A562RUZ2_9BACT|nr:HD domain-containing phosphohydrolase [Desulfobotulus alkaliphilus]TWI72434.1 putative nucleotidyltransferase with HDIG domain [Desulfobotulus alkaliphilus]
MGKEDKQETILFVDDEISILEIAQEFFQHKGYRVFTAMNGVKALEILEKERVGCCFTDINMPEMDGLELAEHIRRMDNTLPVVVMTGYPSLENTIRTLKNGVVDFLIKPVNLNQMDLCVKRVLRERRLFVENLLLKEEVARKVQLENLNRDLEARVAELGILNRIMDAFTHVPESGDVFRRLVDMAREFCSASAAWFYVVNDLFPFPREVAAVSGMVPGAGGPDSRLAMLLQDVASDGLPFLVKKNPMDGSLPDHVGSAMVIPLKIREKVFGLLYAVREKTGGAFVDKDLYYASAMAVHAAHAIENLALYENIYENLFSTLYAFVSAIEAKDAYTQQHSNRVADLSVLLGRELGLDAESLDVLLFAGRLHDIGKIGVRDEVLLKPGRLNDEEYEAIKEHPVIGAGIVGKLGLWNREQEIILYHHERYDGTGYPKGLSGKEIPFLARILSVADAYDAMASDRAYRRRMPENEIFSVMQEVRGKQFDPEILDVFLRLGQEGRLG